MVILFLFLLRPPDGITSLCARCIASSPPYSRVGRFSWSAEFRNRRNVIRVKVYAGRPTLRCSEVGVKASFATAPASGHDGCGSMRLSRI